MAELASAPPPPGEVPAGLVGVVTASFNQKLVAELYANFEAFMRAHGQPLRLASLAVPGSLELAHGMRALAQQDETKQLRVLVALGCVIKGATYHFELVSAQSARAIARVGEDTGIPVINGVLTCYDAAQAAARARANGASFASAAIRMAQIGPVAPGCRADG